jgi:hypothetical protein
MRAVSSLTHHWSHLIHHCSASTHHCMVCTERGILRLFLIAFGFALMVVGLALGVTVFMLPAGIVIGLAGVGLTTWGLVGDIPIDD